jgi:carboxymethylenebutenolidase
VSQALSPAQERMLAAYLRHTAAEFETRRPEDAIASMVASPHVTLFPTLAGGVGRAGVHDFYARHFVFAMPPDMDLVLQSRIVAADHIVEESVMRFTHTVELDWILPGVPPTGRRVEFPVCVVVRMEGERVAHEHIYWDQASVLAQLGLLDAERLPVVGAEAARKLLDPSLPANPLLERARRRGGDGGAGTVLGWLGF